MSLSNRTMLVKLSIAKWSNRTADKNVTRAVASQYHINDSQDVYIKVLIPKQALSEILSIETAARTYHNANTLPWQDGGVRILPSERFFKYRDAISDYRRAFDTAVNALMRGYPDWIEKAKQAKGSLFNEADYPSEDKLRSRFDFQVSLLPFPEIEDFRVNLDDDTVAEIQKNAKETVTQLMANANRDLILRVRERVEKLYNVVSVPKKIFRDNTLEAAKAIACAIDSLNVTDNVAVASAAKLAQDTLVPLNADRLREDDKHRDEAAADLKQLLNTLNSTLNEV